MSKPHANLTQESIMRLAAIPQPAYLMRRQTFNLHTRKGRKRLAAAP